MTMNITTKGGDQGFTSLLGGHRVPKSHARPEAVGALDETNAWLGFVRSITTKHETQRAIRGLQKRLFIIGAEVAAGTPADLHFLKRRLQQQDLDWLERVADEIQDITVMPNHFIVPGATQISAMLDIARTVARRAERRISVLVHAGEIANPIIAPFLNRVSDFLFVLARFEEGRPDVLDVNEPD